MARHRNSGTFLCPNHPLYEHSPCGHGGVPRMKHQVIRAVRSNDAGVMAGSHPFSRERSQHSRTLFVSLIRVWSEDVVADSIVHAVGVILPAAAAIETVITATMPNHTRPLERVPVPERCRTSNVDFESVANPIVRAGPRAWFLPPRSWFSGEHSEGRAGAGLRRCNPESRRRRKGTTAHPRPEKDADQWRTERSLGRGPLLLRSRYGPSGVTLRATRIW